MGAELKGLIRVLVVEDCPLMCEVLMSIFNPDPQILVVGIAHNGKEAIELVPRLKPDIITMDIHMPVMDGFEATKHIMAYNPTPILVISSSVFRAGMDKVFKAISYGALDVIDKGDLEIGGEKKSGEVLIEKIKFLSGIKVIRHPLAKLQQKRHGGVLEAPGKRALDKIVAIVTSTGGPQALLEILKRFPEDFPCGIVIVQHITNGFTGGLVDWLDSECQLSVKIAEDSEEIQSGVGYIAPDNLQMRVREGGTIQLSDEPAYEGHRPSGDVLLESVARAYGGRAVAAILTGMGRDGAMGMKAIKQFHGQTIAQDEKSCVVFGMPKVAIEMNVIDKVLPLEEIAKGIAKMLRYD
ncbi:MAG: chemotaxis response regulator protein-glutamate methylesterase [Nitrospirota bacterium]